jgi:hypothetical protein
MRTAVARSAESRHQESEAHPTLGLAPADDAKHEARSADIDATQGRQVAPYPYDDATQGRQIGSRPSDDATHAR